MPREHKFEVGAAYRNGKLYEFSLNDVTVMKGWPLMLAWKWSAHNPQWVHVRPRLKRISMRGLSREIDPDSHPPELGGQMLFPFAYSYVGRRAYRAFWWAVPDSVRTAVMPFRDHRWHMLSLLARCPGAEDLVASNPALAFCLASNWAFHRPVSSHPLRAARSLVYKKQRQILEWLGFPNTESARQILRRVPPEAMTVLFLQTLRGALRDPRLSRKFSFLSRINADVLSVITDPEEGRIAFSLVEEMAHNRTSDAGPWIASRIRDIRQMSLDLHRNPPQLRSIAQVNQLHDDLVFDYNLQREDDGGPLPPPPLPGKEGEIEPLETCQDLALEGRLQHHCVGSYTHAVRRGKTYVYRMLKPERATLAITFGHRGWSLWDLRGHRNAEVQPESLKAALDWLRSQQSLRVENQEDLSVCRPALYDEIPF